VSEPLWSNQPGLLFLVRHVRLFVEDTACALCNSYFYITSHHNDITDGSLAGTTVTQADLSVLATWLVKRPVRIGGPAVRWPYPLTAYTSYIRCRDSATCPRCNGAEETAEHLVIQCLAHDQVSGEVLLNHRLQSVSADPRRSWIFW